MNWYKKIKLADKYYNDEDIEQYINVILEQELKDLDPITKTEIKEKVIDKISTFPPGYKLRKNIDGWSVISPEGDIVSLNEKKLMYSIPGGKSRFDFMGRSL
ncbi:hypothetical protein LCGC14_3133120 [marine sediment metagenome]|uniref:Uncharacterized protein n=1 Tax=marine sediment metagenome TaxID=412755 RepID=A0A0F8Y629_9ZZZZ